MSSRKEFWKIVCDYRPQMAYLFALLTGLAIITVISFGITDRGSPGHIVSVLNLGILAVAFSLIGYFLWRCS